MSDEAFGQLDRFAKRSLVTAEDSETITELPSFLQRGTTYLVAAALLVTLALLFFGKVHVLVSAKGHVIPDGDIVNLQAVQGGVVNSILARVGDRLNAGSPILKLDTSESGLNLAELKRKQELQVSQLAILQSSLKEVDRTLQAPHTQVEEDAGAAGTAGQSISALENALVKRENARTGMARLPERKGLQIEEIRLTRDNIALNEKNHADQKSVLATEDQVLSQKKEQLNQYRKLAENQRLSQLELSGEEEKFRAAENSLLTNHQHYEQQEIDISNQRLHLAELQSKLLSTQTDADNDVKLSEMTVQQSVANLSQERQSLIAQIQQTAADVSTMAEKIRLAEVKVALTTITMPVSGTLADLKVHNPGDSIGSGFVVASIVPEGSPLIVEATVENKDIGFVTPGLDARIKVDAFPFEHFGTVAAKVSQVLPNAGKDSTFVVRLNLLQKQLDGAGKPLNLFPGLTVEAELLTSQKRLLSLLFSKEGKK